MPSQELAAATPSVAAISAVRSSRYASIGLSSAGHVERGRANPGPAYAPVQHPMMVAATLRAMFARVSGGVPNLGGSLEMSTSSTL